MMPRFWHLAIYSNYQNLGISFDYSWFLAKNLSNFVSLPWKLHNWYCHTHNTENKQKKNISNPPPPGSPSPYKFLRNIWIVPKPLQNDQLQFTQSDQSSPTRAILSSTVHFLKEIICIQSKA